MIPGVIALKAVLYVYHVPDDFDRLLRVEKFQRRRERAIVPELVSSQEADRIKEDLRISPLLLIGNVTISNRSRISVFSRWFWKVFLGDIYCEERKVIFVAAWDNVHFLVLFHQRFCTPDINCHCAGAASIGFRDSKLDPDAEVGFLIQTGSASISLNLICRGHKILFGSHREALASISHYHNTLAGEEKLESDKRVRHHIIKEAGACHVTCAKHWDGLLLGQINDYPVRVGDDVPEGLNFVHHAREAGQGPLGCVVINGIELQPKRLLFHGLQIPSKVSGFLQCRLEGLFEQNQLSGF